MAPMGLSGREQSFPIQDLLGVRINEWYQVNKGLPFRWLDVCCGEGDILSGVAPILRSRSDDFSAQFFYDGVDRSMSCRQRCEQVLEEQELPGRTRTISAEKLGESLAAERGSFDCVSLIRSWRELPMSAIPGLLLDMIQLCGPRGFIFGFDIAALTYSAPKLGATPWRARDIGALLLWLGEILKFREKLFVVDRHHDLQDVWYFFISAAHFPKDLQSVISAQRESLTRQITAKVEELLKSRREALNREIHDSRRFFPEEPPPLRTPAGMTSTADKELQDGIDVLVRDFWAYDWSIANLGPGARSRP